MVKILNDMVKYAVILDTYESKDKIYAQAIAQDGSTTIMEFSKYKIAHLYVFWLFNRGYTLKLTEDKIKIYKNRKKVLTFKTPSSYDIDEILDICKEIHKYNTKCVEQKSV